MFRSLRTTIEYTVTALKYSTQRVKKNQDKGWISKTMSNMDPLFVVEGDRHHRLALELHKSWCYIEFINPRVFPSYVRLNGRPFILKQGQELTHKQNGRTVVIARLSNTKHQNYYILVRAD